MDALAPFDDIVRTLAVAVVGGDSPAAALGRSALQEWIGQSAAVAVPELELPPIDPVALPHGPAVYAISAGNLHYIGLALDVHHRFWNSDYGHLTPANGCRSRLVFEQGEPVIRLLQQPTGTAEDVRMALSIGEISTYARFAVSGLKVVNAVSTLGRVGDSLGAPVVLCGYTEHAYVYCDSLIAAQRLLASTALPAVVHGYQRTALGHAARWALPHEVEQLADLVSGDGILRGEPVLAAVESATSHVTWEGAGRNAGFTWHAGPLSVGDCEQLRRYQRGRYAADVPQSPFNGVSWESSRARWQCRAKTGPGSKDLWQTSRLAWVSDVDAAIFREEKIRAEAWEAHNTGRYASNAHALNALLAEERFSAW